MRKTRKCITGVYGPPPPSPKKKIKIIFAFDICNRYVMLVSPSECFALSCQFAVDSCLYLCNADQELNVLRLKCNIEWVLFYYVTVNNIRRFLDFLRIHFQIEYSTCHIIFDYLWLVWVWRVCRNYPMKGTVFGYKMSLTWNIFFSFSPQILPEILLIPGRIQRNLIVNVYRSSCIFPDIFARFKLKLKFSLQQPEVWPQ